MVIVEGTNQTKQSFIVMPGLLCLIMTYLVFNFIHVQVWQQTMTPVDSILKPLMLFPLVYMVITILYKWTSTMILFLRDLADIDVHWIVNGALRKEDASNHFVYTTIITGTLLSFVFYPLLSVFIWNETITPVEYIVKPLLLLPMTIMIVHLLIRGTGLIWRFGKGYALAYTQSRNGSTSSKENVICFSERKRLIKEHVRREMLYEDDCGVVNQYERGDQRYIHHVLGKSKLVVKNTTYKNSNFSPLLKYLHPKNRMTTSKMWLRLIRGPTVWSGVERECFSKVAS